MLGHLFFQNGFLSSFALAEPPLSDRSSDVVAVACSASSSPSSFSSRSGLAYNGETSSGSLPEACERAVRDERPDFWEAGRELARVESPQAVP
jgi:hypothetical protein